MPMTISIRQRDYIGTDAADSKTWVLGRKFPVIYEDQFDNLITLEATGPELEYVGSHFTGIPFMASASKLTWEGDMAKFIIRAMQDALIETKQYPSWSLEPRKPKITPEAIADKVVTFIAAYPSYKHYVGYRTANQREAFTARLVTSGLSVAPYDPNLRISTMKAFAADSQHDVMLVTQCGLTSGWRTYAVDVAISSLVTLPLDHRVQCAARLRNSSAMAMFAGQDGAIYEGRAIDMVEAYLSKDTK